MKKIIHYIFIVFALIFLFVLLHPGSTFNPEKVKQTFAHSNLKNILISSLIYAEANDGRLPPDWAALFTNYMPIDGLPVFVTHPERDKIGAPDHVMEWTDYVYVYGITTASPPWTIIAYLPAGHIKTKTPYIVAYLDGRVEALGLSDFTKAMNKEQNKAFHHYAPQVARG